MLAALGIHAFEQVRWIYAVSRAHEQRERSELESAARRFSEDVDRELLSVISALEVGRKDWKSIARDPRVIASLSVVSDRSLRFGFDPDSLTLRVPIGGEGSGEGIVAQYDAGYVTQHLIPEMARRYFHGYDIAVVHGDGIVYRSNADWPASVSTADADVAAPLMMAKRRLEERGDRDVGAPWRVLVRRHGQSISQLMAAGRRRDIATAMAIVGALAASLIILVAAIRRAERLRLQQLEFVAGITHELHTPLAALASAGQNLADDVPVDTARYGDAIVRETRRLTDLVDQVLQFSGIEAGGVPRRDEIVDARAAIDDAVAECRWLADERGVQIDVASADRPDVRGNRAAVTRAVQNLVVNAIRHGAAGGWVGVHMARENGFVAISVEDRGDGIPAADLPHLFKPFYRGRNAQTRGSGLGLTIVDRVARVHGGSVTVTKGRERGAQFILRLPSAESR